MKWNWNVSIDVEVINIMHPFISQTFSFLHNYESYWKINDIIGYTLSNYITLLLCNVPVGLIFT